MNPIDPKDIVDKDLLEEVKSMGHSVINGVSVLLKNAKSKEDFDKRIKQLRYHVESLRFLADLIERQLDAFQGLSWEDEDYL